MLKYFFMINKNLTGKAYQIIIPILVTISLVTLVGYQAYNSTLEEDVDVKNSSIEAGKSEVNITNEINQGVEGVTSRFPSFSFSEIQSRSSKNNCWTVINGEVYDLTQWISKHPGGSKAILSLCGKDGSLLFNQQHGEFKQALNILEGLKIGTLE